MSITDHAVLALANDKKTAEAGRSLARSLHRTQTTILLEGPLGAGKTTFVQGLAAGMGIELPVNSPTFALEQRYTAPSGKVLSHLDCYRLTEAAARKLLEEDTEADADVRCIEWADRLGAARPKRAITIRLAETGDARALEADFDDIALPSDADIDEWRRDVLLPAHIGRHCDAVGAFAERCALVLAERGVIARPGTLRTAGRLHDLLRFIDIRAGTTNVAFDVTDEQLARWEEVKADYAGMQHEEACTVFLEQKGYLELARIILTHGMRVRPGESATIEQKLLYYADKRVMEDRVVSLDERFDDFANRYGKGEKSPEALVWEEATRVIERELFGDTPPPAP